MNKPSYPTESIGSRMSTDVPVYQVDTQFRDIKEAVFSKKWSSVRTVYIVDAHGKLVGLVDLADIAVTDDSLKLGDIMQEPTEILHPESDQEKAAYLAIKNDEVAIPVTDKHGVFLGAITAHSIIDIMHEEHVEDALLGAGVRDSTNSSVIKLIRARTSLLVRSRTPWLIVGLTLSMGLGLIASFFEETLEKSIALAFFIPVIVYVADSVGTQASTIAVRALAITKLNFLRYLQKELAVGVLLGLIMGVFGALGALLISQTVNVALVVGLTLLTACTLATILASAVPFTLKRLGKDPALGSGPLATVLQDILSLVIYFLFAMAIIG